MVRNWELEYIRGWSTNEIKNRIWSAVANGQPIQGSISVEALRIELERRGEPPVGYHNT